MKTKKNRGGLSPSGKNQNRNRFVFLSFEVDPLNWQSFIEIGEMACSTTARCSLGQALKPSAEKLFFVVRNHFLWEAKSNEYICKRYDEFTWSDVLWNVCFWIGRIIIDMSQNGFSIDWTTRSTAPFTQGPRGEGVGWSDVYLSKGWLTTHPWQFFSIVSVASSIPGQRVRRDSFVLTIPWWVLCANFRFFFFFCDDCDTTIRLPRRTISSKLDNSFHIGANIRSG